MEKSSDFKKNCVDVILSPENNNIAQRSLCNALLLTRGENALTDTINGERERKRRKLCLMMALLFTGKLVSFFFFFK